MSVSKGALVGAMLVGIALMSAMETAQAQYVAYAVTKDGELPLPETLDGIKHEELVNVKWGEYGGPKSRVGVLPVDNTSGAGSYSISGPGGTYNYSAGNYDQVPVNGIEAMVTDVMHRSNRFRLVERTVVGDVLGEQDLAASGRVSQPSGAKTGKILGAQYLVQAVVTSYEPDFKGKKGGLGGFGRKLFGGVKGGKSQSMVGMNFRLIDAETSEVIFTQQIDAMVGKTEFGLGAVGWGSGGGMGGFFSGYSQTPVGQAVMAAVNMGCYELIKQIGNAAPQGTVVKVEGDVVFVNLGQDAVDVGMPLKAFQKGEELVDPETGLSLGGDNELLGTLKVKSVKEKYCTADSASFDLSRLQRGDMVFADSEPVPMQFASAWEGKTRKK